VKKKKVNNLKEKKGISPLIATVLLIGFTIVLAALVMKWGGELFRTTTTTQGCMAEARLSCASDIEIDVTATQVDTSSTPDGLYEEIDVNIISRTNNNIDGYWIILYRADGTTRPETAEYEEAILAFQSATKTVTLGTGQSDFNDVTRIEVIPTIDYQQADGTQCPTECSEKSEIFEFT